MFVIPATAGLYLLANANFSQAEDELAARIGNLTGRVASGLEDIENANDTPAAQRIISLALADIAILCAEFRPRGSDEALLSAPMRLGCQGTRATEQLSTPTWVGNLDGDLVVMWSREELSSVWRRQVYLAGLVLLAAIVISIGASYLAFRRIVGRPLNELVDEIEAGRIEAEWRAEHDPLTRLPNRNSLDRVLAERFGLGELIVICVDLDHFKQINDVYGHAAGDHVLRHLASLLEAATAADDFVARTGGDEFIIVCQPATETSAAVSTAESILERVSEPITFDAQICQIGASIGIASSASGANDLAELMGFADVALYRAKNQARNAIEIFGSADRAKVSLKRKLSTDSSEALKAGQIVPFYQAQIDALTGRVCGLEVLARWIHPELGLLTPPQFLPVLRQSGREADLDAAMFDQALEDLEKLDIAGVQIPRISFNVSAGRLLDPAFLRAVAERLPEPRDRFAFEILETVSFASLGDQLRHSIDLLKDLGVQLEIDDFGSGQASLNTIFEIEPHGIKIDRSFVQNLDISGGTKEMIRSMVGLASERGMRVVAEGVETRQQSEILLSIGCPLMQGFLFSKPCDFDTLLCQTLQRQAA